LDAAAKVLAEHGYSETRLEDIARAAGTKAGSFYYYFDSREELVIEVLMVAVTRVTTAVRQAVRDLPKGASHRDKVSAAIRAQITMALKQDAYTAASLRIAANLPPMLRLQHLRLEREFGSFWRKLLQGAKAANEISPQFNFSVLRMLLLGAVNWTIEWYKHGGTLTPADIAEQLIAMVFDGIQSPIPSRQPPVKSVTKRSTERALPLRS